MIIMIAIKLNLFLALLVSYGAIPSIDAFTVVENIPSPKHSRAVCRGTASSTASKVEVTDEELKLIESSPIFLSAPVTSDKILPPETLINIAKRFLVDSNGVGGNGKFMSDDFIFEAPVVGPFGKVQFLDAIGGVDFDAGFPDWKGEFYNFQIDPFNPERVWYMAKGEGTNTGPFPNKDLAPTNKKVINPPQICSLTIDSSTGLIDKYTIGYVADKSIGNTGGLGGIYGILYGVGRPLPFPEANPWKPSLAYSFFLKVGSIISKLKSK